MRAFDAFSFKKIVAPDFFESTLAGAWLSITGGLVMVLLFIAELQGYLAVSVTSEVVLAPPPIGPVADLIRVNFDVTLPLLKCQYVTVDLDDVLGRKRVNVTSTSIEKFRVDISSGALVPAPAVVEAPQYGHGTLVLCLHTESGGVGQCVCTCMYVRQDVNVNVHARE